MDPHMILHILSLDPSIDILGQWINPGNAKTAQKSMMRGEMEDRHVKRSRGWRNYRRVWKHIILPKIDDILIFTFVRNPWDKTVSAVHFLQQYHRKYRRHTFQDVLKKELAIHGTDINRHFRPQIGTLVCKGEPIPNLFVGRFERLHEDWAKVADRIGVSRTLPHVNKSQHKPYVEYYDQECIDIVARLYAEEIELLGYQFGD